MKLEEQVVSLDLSKQLKVAGYPQEGLYVYGSNLTPVKKSHYTLIARDRRGEYPNIFNHTIVAPTVAELGEKLSKKRYVSGRTESYWVEKDKLGIWWCASIDDPDLEKGVTADTEANARAKMWLYLKKEKLLT